MVSAARAGCHRGAGAFPPAELLELLRIADTDIARWRDITQRMFIPFHGNGIISQFEGYEDLEELNWEVYRAKYHNIERLDRILRAEEDTADRYKVSKQADVNMLFYLLGRNELRDIFQRLGYTIGPEVIQRSIEYYMERTSHGSRLSKVVFASVIHHLDCDRGFELFSEALRSDVDDVQQGTTGEGIHLGAMAGTVLILLHRYGGVHLGPDGVCFEPRMPAHLVRLRFRVCWHARWLDVVLTPRALTVTADADILEPVPVSIRGEWRSAQPGQTLEVIL
jgi:alpha,alpha-trehalase